MSQQNPETGRGRLQLALVAAIFIGPLLVAGWLYFAGVGWQPAGRTNHGLIIDPIARLEGVGRIETADDARGQHWLLIYAQRGPCDERCRASLFKLRQSRLMLGNDMDRLVRVFLHGEATPDRVFLNQQHAGLITLSDRPLSAALDEKRPEQVEPGGFFLVDPLHNLVMYFPPGIGPRDLVDDIKHLLDLSRIG